MVEMKILSKTFPQKILDTPYEFLYENYVLILLYLELKRGG
jgi:hypothetical protein